MANDQENKFRKITTTVLATVLMLGTAIGAGFSLASTANQVSDKQNYESAYKQKLQLEINVDGNLDVAAKNSMNTLEFLGISGSSVYTIGSNKLVAEIPIESYNDKSGYSLFSTEGLGISDYITESESLALSLLVQGNIEFKTTDGQSLFTLDGNDKPQFIAPTFDTSGETSSPTKYTNLESPTTADAIPTLFSSASVGHYNGSPYISLIPKNDYAKDRLIEWDTWVNTATHSADTETQYVAWIDYSQLESFVTDKFSDYDSTTGLFSYVYDSTTGNVKSYAKPFLISFGQPYTLNKYADEFRLTGNFSERQAKFFAAKINQRKDYSFDYSTMHSNLIVSSKSKILLYVMEVIILLILILVLIMFVWYFGLLGSIGVVAVLLSTLIATTIFVSLSLQISLISLLAVLFAIFATALSSARAINIYKKEKDKSKSKSKKFSKNISEIAVYLFVPTFISTLLLFVVGFMMPLTISSIIYFVTLNIVISYGLTLLFVTPLLYIYDLILSFTTTDINQKWNMISGIGVDRTINIAIINTSKWNAKKLSVSSIIIVLITAVFAGIVGGIVYSTTGSAVNERGFKNISYVYNVENTGTYFEISDPTYSADKTEQQLFDEATSQRADVKQTLSDNGVNVKSMYVVRDEQYSTESSKVKLEVNYGYQITTSKEITSEQISTINGSLTNFEINPDSLSANNSGKINFYSNNQLFIKFMVLIVILVLTSFILFLLFFKWGIGTAFLAAMMFEFTGVIAPLLILYLPFNLFMLLPLIFVASLSIISKIDIARRMRKNSNDNGQWFELANKQQLTSTLAYSALLTVEILLMISYGFLTILPVLLVTVISWIPTMLSSNILFPYIATKFVMLREDDKTTKMNLDIRDSKNPNITTEELIEGINI